MSSAFARELLSFGMRIGYTLLAFAVTVLLARLLSPAPLGRYFEVVAWVLLLGGIVQSGWTPFLVREVAALRESGRETEAVGIARFSTRLIFIIATCAALLLVAGAYIGRADSRMMTLFVIAAPVIVLLSTSSARQAVTRGMGFPLLGQICENLTRPGIQVLGLLLLWLGLFGSEFTPAGALAVFLVAIATSAGLAYWLERRALRAVAVEAKPKAPPWSQWRSSFFHNALIGWSSALNLQIGTLVLAYAAADAQIAEFRIAQQLSLLMALGLTAVGTLYAPSLSRAFARGDMHEIQRLATRASLFSVAASLPLTLLYVFAGGWLLSLLFGAEYVGAKAPLVALTLGQLVNTTFGAVTAISVATRNEVAALRAHVASVVCNVLLAVALVPGLGPTGAAVASGISLAVWNVLIFWHLRRKLGVSTMLGLGGLKSGGGKVPEAMGKD